MEPSGYYNDMLHETRTLSDIAVNWVLFCIKQEKIFWFSCKQQSKIKECFCFKTVFKFPNCKNMSMQFFVSVKIFYTCD